MTDVYSTPQSDLTIDSVNTSGQGKGAEIPDGVAGLSFGAFFFNWIWAIFNKTWLGLLALVPYIGFVVAIILLVKGREWAWQNKRWESVEHFQKVQRRWSLWGWGLLVFFFVIGILAAIALPAYQSAVQ